MDRMLESDEAARRLGVKLATLYAYVSRGLLPSHPSPTGRRSLFDSEDIEQLAHRSRGGKTVETRLATVTTSITQLRADGPAYRGVAATELARTSTYEEVAERLWNVEVGPGGAGSSGTGVGAGVGAGTGWDPLPLGVGPELAASDLMRWAVVMVGALDPLRADLRPEAVTRTARRVTATMVEVLRPPTVSSNGGPSGSAGGRASMAERLAGRLSPAPTEELVRCLAAALVLMADHELATSTVAVRVAASTRAGLCDALLAGLGTIAGPLHGGASQLAYSLLVDAQRHGAAPALNEALRRQRLLPGFGHTVYTDGDPRFDVLFELFERMATSEQLELVQSVVDLAGGQRIPPPNLDLGLAAIVWASGMPPDAGQTLFTVARVAGWTAHYLEELEERPLRFRARAVYASTARGPGAPPA